MVNLYVFFRSTCNMPIRVGRQKLVALDLLYRNPVTGIYMITKKGQDYLTICPESYVVCIREKQIPTIRVLLSMVDAPDKPKTQL